jgi:hypothetical protein
MCGFRESKTVMLFLVLSVHDLSFSNLMTIIMCSFLRYLLKQEHDLYPEVVAALCEGRIFWRDDGVPIIRDDNEGEDHANLRNSFVSAYDST